LKYTLRQPRRASRDGTPVTTSVVGKQADEEIRQERHMVMM
jgi:hypothetical protein